jgi:FkbM family methyltransferase
MSFKLPWTLSFVREWWPHMSLRSVLRLRDYELRSNNGGAIADRLITLEMRYPVHGEVSLREVGSDIHTFTEVFKEQVYQGLLSQVKECRTVIDLGANIGLAALYFTASYPKCRLLAIEPHPGTYQVLGLNLKPLIEEGRCKSIMGAVWGREAMLVGASADSPEHYSVFAMQEATGTNGKESQTRGLSMQGLIAESGFETIDILKIDIEGAEVELFKGDAGWLAAVGSIAIEFHDDSREVSGFDSLMQQYGFRVIDGGLHTVLAIRQT